MRTLQRPDGLDTYPDLEAPWGETCDRLLDILVELTGCDTAIVRYEASDAQHVVLEDFRVGEKLTGGMAIPRHKLLRFWNGDAFSTCFHRHYPDSEGSLAALTPEEREEHSPEEQEFLKRVHWRGSFPLSLKYATDRVAILVSFDELQPEWLNAEQMCLAWLAAQLSVAQGDGDSGEPTVGGSYVNAVRHLPALAYLPDASDALSALVRLLCSGRGLGWQRAWLMRRTAEGFECETCAGGLTLEDWRNAAAFASSGFGDLADEIAHDVFDQPRENDRLYQLCVRSGRLRIDDKTFESSSASGAGTVFFQAAEEMDFDSRGKWKNALGQKAEENGSRFEDDERVFYCPFRFEDADYVAVVTWSNQRAPGVVPPAIATGIVLAVASLMGDARRIDASEKVASSTHVSELVSRFTSLLSWLGTPPLTKEQLTTAKLRRSRLRFESSQTYRDEVGEQMRKFRSRLETQADP